jgi:hypothetical protein
MLSVKQQALQHVFLVEYMLQNLLLHVQHVLCM